MPQLPPPSAFAEKLAGIADDQHERFHLIDENDEPLRSQIENFWQTLGFDFPGVETPWSAVFVSFCVKTAGATGREFKFSTEHSEFVHEAINNPGAFRGVDITAEAVNVGDIIQNNRSGNNFSFAFATKNKDYKSHSAIVVDIDEDENGKFALTVGGNESDSIRKKRVQLDDIGKVVQRSRSSFICVLKNQKE